MLNITKNSEGEKLTINLEGRLDTTTAPELDKVIADSLIGVKELEFDLAQLEYISSAGLRVLLSAQKHMKDRGTMVLVNATEVVREIFDITGFSDILTIK